MENIQLKIEGMSCASCANLIEREVSGLAGVKASNVNYAIEAGTFVFEKDTQNQETVVAEIHQKIKELGFSSELSTGQVDRTQEKQAKIEKNFRQFAISILLAISLFALAMWPLMGWPSQKVNHWLQFILCIPVYAWTGKKFQLSLLNFLRTGKSNMHTLIGLGTTSAFLYSFFITIAPELSLQWGLTQKVYFEAVGFIISFVYLGQYFEEKAKMKTTEALNSLLKLGAKTATLVREDSLEEVEIAEVQVGDILRVKPGGKFPVDGKVVKGNSSVDESMISGEPLPVFKEKGSYLFAGTINGDQVIDYRATKVGANTFLAQIIHFVEQAQGSKPEIQKLADKVSGIFTPVVITLALLTLGLWLTFGQDPIWGRAVSNFIAVLVIACPCALGLATPTAVVVATGKASLKGILISGGDILEKAVHVDTVIFDKTGTITEGKPTVTNFISSSGDDVLKDIASIEQFSEHPLAKAVTKFANDKGLDLGEPDEFEVVKGKGILAAIDDRKYIIGNKSLLNDHAIQLSEKLLPNTIGSTIFVALNQVHVATLIVGDQIKETSKEAIRQFHEQGIETWMITGDNEAVAKSVCDELGIKNYLASALPLEKSKKIEELQKLGKNVAMVGDGVNDAPALAKANLSLAMGTGTDVAINASDITLVKGDLLKAVEFIKLSKESMKIIKQNLFLSFVYNSLLIPVAGGVLVIFGGPLMPPVLASVAMALSSVSVVTNSLRINIREAM